MTEPAYIPVKTREMDHLGLVNRNADREEKRRTDDTLAQAKAIMSRPNAVSSTGQLNPRVVSREEARIILASGLTDRAPTRLSQARSIQPWEAAGNVMGGVLGEAHRMSQHAAGSLARVAPTPEKENARRIYAEAKNMGMTDEQAARAAWQGINAPWGVKGAIELATDPLNLLPGVGFGGAIARGTGAVARGTGRGLAAGAKVLGDPLEEALTGGMRVPGSSAPPMGGRLSFVDPKGTGRRTGTGRQPDPSDVSSRDTDFIERYTQYEREFRGKTGTVPEGSGSFGVPSGSRSRAFHRGINRVRRNESGLDIYGAAVDVKPQRFYADPSNTLFLDAKGTAGAAVSQEGELVSVFKLRGQTDTDMGALLNEATKGSRFLDAFDINGVLPDLYAKHGFRAVARVTFDPAVAPKGWDISKLGTPDIVFMVRDTNGVTGLTDIVGSGGYASIRETVPLVPYDEATRLRDLVLQKMPQRTPTVGAGRTTRRAGDPSTLRAINTANVTFNVGRKAYNMAFVDLEDKALYLAGETGKKRGKVSQDIALDHLERRTGRPRADLLAEAKQYNREVKQWVRKAKPEPGDTSVPRPQSEPLYRTPDVPDAVPIAKLPDDLGGAAPKYNMGRKAYVPQFENDIDKALFIVAQKTPSKRDVAYMDWLRGQLPDLSDQQIRSAGVDVRAHIKATVKGAPEGDVVIPRSKFVQESAAAKKTDTTLGDRIDALDESVDDYLHTPGSMGDAEHRQKLEKILKDVGFAANIRMAKYSSDQAAELARWAAEHPDEIEAATRGVVSDEQVLANAKKLVQSVGGDEEALMKRWRAGQAWNAEEVTAIRGALADRTQAVADQAAKAIDPSANTAEELAKLFIAMERHAAVQKVVHGITSEAGRALRAFRQEASESLFMKDVKSIENLIIRAGGTRAQLENYADAIVNAVLKGPGIEQDVAIQKMLEKAYTPTTFEKVMELWINSILSGPKTHIINILSNTANAVTSPIERLGAAFVDNIVAPLQGRQRERFYTEAVRDAAAWKNGIQDGIHAGFRAIQLGSNPSAASKYEFRRRAIKGRIGNIVRLPGTMLEAADAMHSTINLASAKNALAYRRAAKKGLDGADLENEVHELIHNPKHEGYYELHKEALEHAEYRLFRNELGPGLQLVMELRQKVPFLKFIMPFMRTPANLLAYGVARSPLAFAPIPLGMLSRSKINIGMWKTLAEKNPEFSDQFARAFLGTMAATMLAFGVAKGRITGATPHTAGARDRFYREGKLPYSIRIGNHWVQYSRLEPFNQVLAQIAAVFPEEGWEDDDETVASNASKVVFSIGENMISQTYMSGLSDLIAAIRNPEMYSDSYLGRVASGLVPASSLLRTIAGIQDPTIRKPVKESAFPGTILDRIAMTFPSVPGFEGQKGLGGRTGAQAKLTAFGEETRIPRAAVLSPIQFRRAQQSNIDRQLDLLGVEVGFVSNSVGGQKLTSEQHQEYKRIAGQLTLAALMQLVDRPGFGDMSVERRENLVLDTIASARRRARGQMLRLLRQSGAYVGRGSEVPDTAPEGTGVLGTLGNVLFGSPDTGTEGYDPTAHENFGW